MGEKWIEGDGVLVSIHYMVNAKGRDYWKRRMEFPVVSLGASNERQNMPLGSRGCTAEEAQVTGVPDVPLPISTASPQASPQRTPL